MSDTQLDNLKAQADSLGVKYHHKAGAAKIQALIDAHQQSAHNQDTEDPAGVQPIAVESETDYEPPLSEAEYLKRVKAENRKNVGLLVRCIVQNMNPEKKLWPGEIISVGSAKLGTFKKYIPYNGEPYHIPKIIYDAMEERMCSTFHTVRDDKGGEIRKAKQIKEFRITVLPPLSKEELAELSIKQQRAIGV